MTFLNTHALIVAVLCPQLSYLRRGLSKYRHPFQIPTKVNRSLTVILTTVHLKLTVLEDERESHKVYCLCKIYMSINSDFFIQELYFEGHWYQETKTSFSPFLVRSFKILSTFHTISSFLLTFCSSCA